MATLSKSDLAFVNPIVLSWAMSSGGISRATIADKLKISEDQLASWERPGTHPPFPKAQALAKLLRIPFGFLFLSTPPQSELPLPDFRGFDDKYRPTGNLRELLNDVLVKQDWYRDYLRDQKEPRLSFAGAFSISDGVDIVAEDIRRILGINATFRSSITSWSDHVTKLSRQAEAARILVMRSSVVGNVTLRPISIKEVQGFAIADDMAPLIFVNSADFKAPQVFTLAHELAHIWIGQSGIDNPNESKPGLTAIEAFCNRVAAEVLVPERDFVWSPVDPSRNVSALAREFWVSAFVILRRARELGKISVSEFQRLEKSESSKIQKKPDGGGGDYFRNVLARMGGRFTNAVLGEVNRGTVTFRDGARLIGVKVPAFVKMADRAK